ncbi:hypothetical protein LCGC14_0979950 [marine sediment metagenome]|uniref:Uncharacterized protein n=1 Tax=marine sediment metagenome TaxID=412755 RepID=A0A0F9RFJ9_9ZZZZ
MVDGWKVTAIIFMVLFIIENLLFGYGFYLINEDDKKADICYYELCKEFPEATYEVNICTCYQYNEDGNYEVNETILMFDG